MNTLKELWDYCLFCPVCQLNVRTVIPYVGPDNIFILEDYKYDNNLVLNCKATILNSLFKLNFNINCDQNTFVVDILEFKNNDNFENKSPTSYLYLAVKGQCDNCLCTSVISSHLTLNLLDNKIYDIKLWEEDIYLINTIDMFHIKSVHHRGDMVISKMYRKSNSLLESNKQYNLNIIDFDFTDHNKVIQKIKTILVFS